jgi:hypothetical protein
MEVFRAMELTQKAQSEFSKLSPLIKMQAGAVITPLIGAVHALTLEVATLKNEVLKNGK